MKPTYLMLFYALFCISLISNAQIVNEGDLKINTGTTVYFGEEYTNTATGNHECNGDLYLNSSFVNHGFTSAKSGTTFFKSNNKKPLKISGTSKTVNFYNLEIDVTSANPNGLSILNNLILNVDNKINLKNGDLKLLGTSQLIQNTLKTPKTK